MIAPPLNVGMTGEHRRSKTKYRQCVAFRKNQNLRERCS